MTEVRATVRSRGSRSILFVHSADEAYGADRILLSQMVGLRDRGWRIRLALPDDLEPGWLSAAAEAAEIPVERLSLAVARRRYLRPAGLLAYAGALLRARRALRAIVRRDRPDIVHVNTSALLVAAILGRPSHTRLVWHIHEIVVRPRMMAWLFRVLPVLTADRVVAVSDAVRHHLVGGGSQGRRVVTVHNGLDARVAAPLASLVGGSRPIVAFVGRLNRWKGYELFIEAVAKVAPIVPLARFVVAGDPPPGEEWRVSDLVERIHRAGLDSRVERLGFVPDGAAVFDAADIAVVPSTWPDPLPTVVLEAMRAGCAVIATNHGGAPEMIDVAAGAGILVRPSDASRLASAIGELLADEGRRKAMARAGQRQVAERFSTASMLDGLERVYLDVLR